MDVVHSHSPFILYTPRSRCRYPIGAISPRTQVVLFPLGVETGRPPQQPEPGPRPPAPTPVPNDPHPHAERGSCTKESNGPNMVQTSPPTRATQNEIVPAPQ
ncbi:hypothetical protein ILYODFUR_021901 [Ilyodon furcidens]|uniref:Uncharacterized protein n=1 Tax=Ilyodon furcidens TaxID=33524 RepID=A0ABV0U7F0_9TELE